MIEDSPSTQFYKLDPRNDEWNRKYNFTADDSMGFLIEIKNGLAYFGWNFTGDVTKYYHCEQSVFEKRFRTSDEIVTHQIPANTTINFIRYPTQF